MFTISHNLFFKSKFNFSIDKYNTGLLFEEINKKENARGVCKISNPLKLSNQAIESRLDKK